MNVYMVDEGRGLRITIQVDNRDELEKAIAWIPSLRPLYPYPDPPPLPKPGEFMDMGSAAPPPSPTAAEQPK